MPRQIVHVGRKIQVALDTEVLPGGETIRRDVVLHPGAVAILPFVSADHVCLLENYRPIVGATLWEIPAGTLEPGEQPLDAAKRELAEETGYRAQSWELLTTIIPSPGVLDERIWLFRADDLQPGSMRPEPCESLVPRTVPVERAIRWIADGTIVDAKTMIALFWTRLLDFGKS